MRVMEASLSSLTPTLVSGSPPSALMIQGLQRPGGLKSLSRKKTRRMKYFDGGFRLTRDFSRVNLSPRTCKSDFSQTTGRALCCDSVVPSRDARVYDVNYAVTVQIGVRVPPRASAIMAEPVVIEDD